jgi:hypothetical protein
VQRSRPSPAWLSVVLGVTVAAVLVVWRLWPAAPDVRRAPAHDDFELLPADPDERSEDAGRARVQAPGRDVLGAGPGGIAFADARDGSVVAMAAAGGPRRTIDRDRRAVLALAVAGDAVWIARAGAEGEEHGGSVAIAALGDGGAPRVIATQLGRPRGVACDGRWLVVVDEDVTRSGLSRATTIARFPATGGERVALGRSQGEVTNVVLDGDRAFWADALDGTVVAVPVGGGELQVLARERGLPGRVAVGDGAVFWTEKRTESIWTVPASGGTPREVVQDFAGFATFVVAGGSVVWVNETAVDGGFRVFSAPLAGGETAPLTPTVDAAIDLAASGSHLFWARAGEVRSLNAP